MAFDVEAMSPQPRALVLATSFHILESDIFCKLVWSKSIFVWCKMDFFWFILASLYISRFVDVHVIKL